MDFSNIETKFAERLKELRTENRYSQAELGRILGLGNATICYWEKGQTHPVDYNIVKVAKFFKVSADYLLGLEDFRDDPNARI